MEQKPKPILDLIFCIGIGIVLCIFACGLFSTSKLDAEYIGPTVLHMLVSAFIAVIFLYVLRKIVLNNFKS